jgi:hypothetical protein
MTVMMGKGASAKEGMRALFMFKTPIITNWKMVEDTRTLLKSTRQICPPVSTPVTNTYLILLFSWLFSSIWLINK